MPQGKIRQVVHLHQCKRGAGHFFVRVSGQIADDGTAQRRLARPQIAPQADHVAPAQDLTQTRGEGGKFRFVFNPLRDGWHLQNSYGT